MLLRSQSIFLLTMAVSTPVLAAQESAITAGQVSGLLLSLLLVIGLIFACAWLVKRVSGIQHSSSKQLKIVSSLSLGTKERAVLIQVGDEQILLGVAPGRVSALKTLENNIQVTAPEPIDFAAQLKKLTGNNGDKA